MSKSVKESILFSDPAMPLGSALLAVITSPAQLDKRKHIRNSWCGECNKRLYDCRCIFVLGLSSVKGENEDVKKEAKREGDILQMDLVEHYNNLTLKTMHVIRWARFDLDFFKFCVFPL